MAKIIRMSVTHIAPLRIVQKHSAMNCLKKRVLRIRENLRLEGRELQRKKKQF